MLYKVFMGETFADEPDRVGIIAARSLQSAAVKLYNQIGPRWLSGEYALHSREMDWEDPSEARVTCYSTGKDGKSGVDVYRIVPHVDSPDMLLFLLEDGRDVFSERLYETVRVNVPIDLPKIEREDFYDAENK